MVSGLYFSQNRRIMVSMMNDDSKGTKAMRAVDIAGLIAANIHTNEDLNTLIRAINHKRTVLTMKVKNQFRANEKVEFTDRRTGLTVQGIVVKVMPKNIRVLQTNGRTVQWTVSPTLLRKAV